MIFFRRFGIFFCTFFLLSCGVDRDNSDWRFGRTGRPIDERLDKTREIRRRIDAFKGAVAEANLVLREISKVVDITVNNRPGDRIGAFMVLFHETLKNLLSGLVELRNDGSFSLERRVFSSSFEEVYGCNELGFRLAGNNIEESEQFQLEIDGCDERGYERISTLTLQPNGVMDLIFYPATLDRLIPDLIQYVRDDVTCSIKIGHDERLYARLSCDGAIKFDSENYEALLHINFLEIEKNLRNIDGNIELTIREKNEHRVVSVSVTDQEIDGRKVTPKVNIEIN